MSKFKKAFALLLLLTFSSMSFSVPMRDNQCSDLLRSWNSAYNEYQGFYDNRGPSDHMTIMYYNIQSAILDTWLDLC
jgi:hypothetical protein